jgi:hypothetical protein
MLSSVLLGTQMGSMGNYVNLPATLVNMHMPEIAELEPGSTCELQLQLVLLKACASDITPGGLLLKRSCLLQGCFILCCILNAYAIGELHTTPDITPGGLLHTMHLCPACCKVGFLWVVLFVWLKQI